MIQALLRFERKIVFLKYELPITDSERYIISINKDLNNPSLACLANQAKNKTSILYKLNNKYTSTHLPSRDKTVHERRAQIKLCTPRHALLPQGDSKQDRKHGSNLATLNPFYMSIYCFMLVEARSFPPYFYCIVIVPLSKGYQLFMKHLLKFILLGVG